MSASIVNQPRCPDYCDTKYLPCFALSLLICCAWACFFSTRRGLHRRPISVRIDSTSWISMFIATIVSAVPTSSRYRVLLNHINISMNSAVFTKSHLTPRELGASPYCWQCRGAIPARHGEQSESGIETHRAMTSGSWDPEPRGPWRRVLGEEHGRVATKSSN